MTQGKYRVIQWATGTVGKVALKHFIENPVIELVGVYVTNPAKVGKDAGELVGLPPTGVIAPSSIRSKPPAARGVRRTMAAVCTRVFPAICCRSRWRGS